MGLRDHLVQWRRRLGLSQADLADHLHLHKSAVSRIEAGERGLDSDVAEQWASRLGLKILLVSNEHEDLLRFTSDMKAQDLALLYEIAKLIPRLDTSDRRTLVGLIETWRRSYRSEQEPELKVIGKL